jgi:CheY-like chemotaxis protein
MIDANDRCLIVEDNVLILMDLEDMVQSLGFKFVDRAANLPDAMALVKTHQYRLAILDLYLGGNTSLPLSELLKSHDIPFAVATGYSVGDELPLLLEGVPIISKPYSVEDIKAVMAELLGE